MSPPWRILHAIRSDGFAGVERHVATLAAAQHDAGHRVAVIGGDPYLMDHAVDRPGVRRRPASTTWDTARAIDAFARCDVLHVHMTAAELAALLAPRAIRVPVVSTRHFAGRRGSGLHGRVLAGVIAPRLAAQIAISRFVAAHIDGASTVVHPGVPVLPDGVGAHDRARSVLVVQRLEEEKRTDVAIRAFAASRLAAASWRLDVAGDGAERASLEALAEGLGVADAVRFLGRRDDVEALMTRAGLLLAPCPAEGLGLAVVEAMAAGLPVVAAQAGGHTETVGAVGGGALFPSDDAESAAGLLAGLAADPGRRDAYGAALRAYQREHFTLEAQERATSAVYRSVLR